MVVLFPNTQMIRNKNKVLPPLICLVLQNSCSYAWSVNLLLFLRVVSTEDWLIADNNIENTRKENDQTRKSFFSALFHEQVPNHANLIANNIKQCGIGGSFNQFALGVYLFPEDSYKVYAVDNVSD